MFPRYGEHISLGIGISKVGGTHMTWDMCLSGRGANKTRNMCFSGGGTHITRDMCFPGMGNIYH